MTITGPLTPDLAAQLRQASLLVRETTRLPRSAIALQRRISEDRDLLARVLKSNGFYAPRITIDLDESEPEAVVTVTVDPGVLYLLGDYRITYDPATTTDRPDRPLPRDIDALGLYLGQPATAETFLAAEQKILTILGDSGYPAPQLTPRYQVDHARRLILARIDVFPGRFTRFGPLSFSGLETVSPGYVARLARWRDGEVYSQTRIEELRADLRNSNLFSKITLRLDDPTDRSSDAAPPGDPELDASAQRPVTAELVERKHKIVSATIGGTTGEEKVFGKLGWENRNFWREGETVKLEAAASLIQQSGKIYLNKPNYRRRDQSLQVSAELRREDSKALTEKAAAAQLGLTRELWRNWSGSAGLAGEFSRQQDEDGQETYTLGGLPLALIYDSRDDRLDPSKGLSLTLNTTPWANLLDSPSFFLRNEVNFSTYWDPFASRRTILALRGRLGSLLLSDNKDIPPNKRFYAGGGGAVRGYEFRSLGDLDSRNDPTGGSSVVEFSTELRQRLGEDFGVVGFVDGGQVYNDPTPQLRNGLQWALGVGLRYYTIAGPLRADFAFPLNPRASDKSFQFYISLGQAF